MNEDIYMESSSPKFTTNDNFNTIYYKKNLLYTNNSSEMNKEKTLENNCNTLSSSFNIPLSSSTQFKEQNQHNIFSSQIGAKIIDEAVAIEYIKRMKSWCPSECFEVFFGDVEDTPIEFMKINQLILTQGGNCYGGNIFKVQKYLLSIPQLLVKKGILSPVILNNSYIWNNWLSDLSIQLNSIEWQAFWYIYTNVFGVHTLPLHLISFFNIFAQNQQISQQSIEQIIMNAPLNPSFTSYTTSYLNSIPLINNNINESNILRSNTINQKILNEFNTSELSPFYMEKRKFYFLKNKKKKLFK
uniref:Uncharacterized protein n=1 Tax=Strongyloides stercoralis TaxID=6248 RepID=A0A0K0ESS0_STRER